MKFIVCLSYLIFSIITDLRAQNNFATEILSGYKGDTIEGLKTLKKSINFCVIGDWGRNGQYNQKEVANVLGATMVGIDGDFIISTGDNFYPKGVKSVSDPLFNTSFENIYTMQSTHENWYVVLGNHDYKENPNAQVEYSKISRRWYIPFFYYSFKKEIDSANFIEFFCIDTNPFQSDYYNNSEYLPNVSKQDTSAQIKWLVNSLAASKATWKIVVGHHPLYSAGKRKGKTFDMENRFRDIFSTYKVDVYLCGHEHHLEYDKVQENYFHHFISGSGSEVRPVTNASYAKFVAAEAGIFSFSLSKKKLQIQAINQNLKVIFEKLIIR